MAVENLPPMDIRTFMNTLIALLALGAFFSVWSGIRTILDARDMRYVRVRRKQLINGWRLVFLAFFLGLVSVLVSVFGEPVAYQIVPITETPTLEPTETMTPTLTLSPTISLTPTITLTLAESYTPTVTPTPHVPLAVEAQFSSSVTPSGDAVFSRLTFATGYDAAYNPLGASEQFTNPVGHLYALFSYDQMINGVQWTALWYREGELVYFETLEWDGGTGGYGFSDWNPEPGEWLPGFYQVVIFVGLDAKVSGDFEVVGLPATVTPTPTITLTPTVTLSPTPTHTRWPTNTPAP
jgi:hypothetical protein